MYTFPEKTSQPKSDRVSHEKRFANPGACLRGVFVRYDHPDSANTPQCIRKRRYCRPFPQETAFCSTVCGPPLQSGSYCFPCGNAPVRIPGFWYGNDSVCPLTVYLRVRFAVESYAARTVGERRFCRATDRNRFISLVRQWNFLGGKCEKSLSLSPAFAAIPE